MDFSLALQEFVPVLTSSRRSSLFEPTPSLHVVGHVGKYDDYLDLLDPKVRMVRPILDFCSPKTCSTRARVLDWAALPR